ncbi:HEAT repeat domain-containing protein [Micromonospora maritima]|uniref:HEAT repeat domain-containing protein n=1 Tax=Micromonospora maritima TaxID=986711 RepID=UPI00157BC69B|nr:ankyrin repeat domain-containing protein [Micromonospora maritima]
MDAQLLTAVRAGDARSTDALLRAVPADVLAGADGSALLRAATVAGHTDVVATLLDAGVDPNRIWADGTDPVSWAADHGLSELLQELLRSDLAPWRKPLREDAVRRALDVARRWLGVDPARELRRRLGAAPDEPVVVERERIPVTDSGPHATRIRVRAADGRFAEVQTSHRAIVTHLEGRLGTPAHPDELLARALHFADPGSCDWVESQTVLTDGRDPEETFRWAEKLVAHPCVDTRRFAAEVVHRLSFVERPFQTRAVEVLRPRLRAEADPIALDRVIGAFAEYTGSGDPTDLLPHARHPEPEIRRRVAGELGAALGDLRTPSRSARTPRSGDIRSDVVAALIVLASDGDGPTRANALLALAESDVDTAQVRDLLTARLADDDQDARFQAAVGLALRADPEGGRALRRIGAGAGDDIRLAERVHWAQRRLARRATERPPT